MSSIGPKVKAQFDSLSTDLKNAILERNVQINTLTDLVKVLEEIVAENE